jgi:Domain of unknown function (DUF4115)
LSRQSLSSILFWTVAALSALLLVLLVLVIGGVVPVDSPGEQAEPASEALEPPPAPTTTSDSPARSTPRQTQTEPLVRPAQTVVVVTAARGDSWVSARVGSASGRVLDERVLAQGESSTFRGVRIWLSVGASGNVDVTVDGEPTTLPPGTVSVVLASARA